MLVAGLLPFIGTGSLAKVLEAPWYTWLGGILGAAIIYTVTVAASIPPEVAAAATTAIITAQVVTACIIDHFGLFWPGRRCLLPGLGG